MKILLASIGTRGDMEPFLAIGEKLVKQGHQLLYLFPEQYLNLVPEGFEKVAMSRKFVELVESEDGKVLMGGKIGYFKKIRSYYRLYKVGMKINHEMYREQYECIESRQPDIIIHHPKCLYPLVWRLKYGKKTVMVSPVPYIVHKVDEIPHLGFGKPLFRWWNRFTYELGNYGIVKTLYDEQSSVPKNPQYTRNAIKKALLSGSMVYTISPALFQREKSWHEDVQVLGYHERNKTLDWTPEEGLLHFLAQHPKVILLTFGSMVNPEPEQNSGLLYEVFNILGIPVLVNTAGGGLIKTKKYQNNNNFYFVEQLPYDWIMKRVYGVVHHGGSGTTHSGIKNGCVTLILPHIIDQYVWNEIVHQKGAGPRGVALKDLTTQKFETLLVDLWNNASYRENAKLLADHMKNEDFETSLLTFITK
jgi:UDP:flavonoid glycosyltransferase YjiC (YdhE family)